MSIDAACAWSLARSLCIATVGTFLAVRICRVLHSGNTHGGRILWALVLLPVFTPGLLIGYGYRNFSLSLVHQPLWNEAVYAALTLLLAVPIGALILLASPPAPISPAGLHVARLLREGAASSRRISGRTFVGMQIRARLYALLPAWGAMFLLSFQETEIATLMQAAGWPEWTFTRLATGMELADTVWSLWMPVAIQLGVIAAALGVISRGGATAAAVSPPQEVSKPQTGIAWAYAVIALLLLIVVPGSYVLRGTWEGFAVLAAHPRLMQQIGVGLLFGATAGLLAWLASGVIVARLRKGTPLLVLLPLLLPGLLGAWMLGLVLAALFHQPLLQSLYDTPLPMILGEVLFQLPRALLVQVLLGRWRDSSAVHSAHLLASASDAPRRRRAAGLLWRLDGSSRLTGAMIVCYWAYMELSIPSPALLGPPGMTSAPVLLYNQMHYGQIPGLSALVLATLAVPVVCLLVMSLCARSVAVRRQS